MKNHALILLGIVMTFQVQSQPPHLFKYQGVARYNDGTLIVNKSIALKCDIFRNGSIPDSVVYSEIHHVVTGANGIFSLTIGNGTTSNDFNSINWTSGIYSLGISIDDANGTNFSSMGSSPLLSVPYAMYAENAANGSSQWNQNGSSLYYNNGKVGIGSTNPTGILEIQGSLVDTVGKSLFEVKDHNGETVFAVYEDSVRIFLPAGTKGGRGGFAVGSRTAAKGILGDIMLVTPDSIRMYIDDSPQVKGGRGGFAVGGRGTSKNSFRNYFDISGKASAEIINPSQPRILWYPKKEAFLTGRVLIENPDSIGTNSLSAGFESKAVGNFSQAMGYKCISRGDNSTAFGDSSLANGKSSFAAGVNAKALVPGTFALGKDVIAKGIGSFSIGLNTMASGLNSVAIGTATNSSGAFAIAMGTSTQASNGGSIALGNNANSSGFNAISLGLSATASGDLSSALGNQAQSSGINSTALGYASSAKGPFTAVLGSQAFADGEYALAFGANARAESASATAIGYNAAAHDLGGIAIGENADAKLENGISIGTLSSAQGINATSIGFKTRAIADYSTAVGNDGTIASGIYSMAFGWQANTNNQEGSVVFGDHSTNSAISAEVPNQFVARMDGGYKLYSDKTLSAGVTLVKGSGTWDLASDRNKKENFLDVNKFDVLGKLATLNIQTWNYKSQDRHIRHIGVTAQDFYQAFQLGTSDTTVSEVDLAGISMVGIQALVNRTDKLQQEMEELRSQNAALKKEIEMLKDLVQNTKSK